MNRSLLALAVLFVLLASAALRAEDKNTPADYRLGPPKTLNDYFPMKVPASKEAWDVRRRELREQLLVALGLWPMPERSPLNPVIHGKIDRDGYTIEKVFFASHPGHYVSGNLYRPKGKTGLLPGVLCPHGHWANGRFYDAGEKAAQEQIKQEAENTVEGARYPLQARCAQLARMGCIVFHYDMVGNADSQQIPHRQGFTDTEAELRLQSFMGLQTWNSIRALDFMMGLPDVDTQRIGVTGASGGGTQTFILSAIDDRPTVAFPAVMVSTAMQGGCICENCSYLRQDTGNIELAALFAPKPLGMTGANDWTIDIEKKGLPELKALYRLYNAEDRVMAKCFPQFGHNYNQVSREVMYNWFNKHLKLGLPEPVVEQPFVPVPPKELSVFDEQHPRPSDAVDAQGLRKHLAAESDKRIQSHLKDGQGTPEFHRVVGTALRVIVGGGLPSGVEMRQGMKEEKLGELRLHKTVIGHKGEKDALPALGIIPPGFDGTVTVWVHPKGQASLFDNGEPVPEAKAILAKKSAILVVDCLSTGENGAGKRRAVDAKFAGYTFGYNRPLLAERVRDILAAVAFAKETIKAKKIHLVGWEQAGVWALLARGLSGDVVTRTAVDLNRFRFADVKKTDDEMMLPGALKYGDLPAFVALCGPGEVKVHNHDAVGTKAKLSPEQVVQWLLR